MTSASPHLLIYGAGGFGREVAWLASEVARGNDSRRLVAYIDDDVVGAGASVHGTPVLTLEEAARAYPGAAVAIAVGNPTARGRIAERLPALGLSLASLIHPDTHAGPRVRFGDGVIICRGCTLTSDISVGRLVQINLHCTIGHDADLGDCATLAPGVHISGCCRIGASAYVGTGAVVINGTSDEPLTIGSGAVIGAGAVVTRIVPSNETWVGVPARAISRRGPGH